MNHIKKAKVIDLISLIIRWTLNKRVKRNTFKQHTLCPFVKMIKYRLLASETLIFPLCEDDTFQLSVIKPFKNCEEQKSDD